MPPQDKILVCADAHSRLGKIVMVHAWVQIPSVSKEARTTLPRIVQPEDPDAFEVFESSPRLDDKYEVVM